MASPWCRHPLKRGLDVVLGLLLLILLSPLLLLLAAAVRLTLGGPVLFRQVRPGRDATLFTLYKFRTMRDGPGSDTERITPLGHLLRRTGLDELPELWNILRGDMSFIGPRPLLPEYLDRYSPEQARRHDTRPGLTGLAQVNGRNTLSWPRKFELDVHYVDHATPLLDLRILALTALHLLTGGRGHHIPEEFKGPDGSQTSDS